MTISIDSQSIVNSRWQLGSLSFDARLIQGPLAGYSAAPFRARFSAYQAPAYAVSEMLSAQDVLTKHEKNGRYLARFAEEKRLAYQIAGSDSAIMAAAAAKLEQLGADIIDINCGCPKTKIRKKGAGSALLAKPESLLQIVSAVRAAIRIPLTVKIRLTSSESDAQLTKDIEAAGADALIVHGRGWQDDYAIACDYAAIAAIKSAIKIPVIANGDIADKASLKRAIESSAADAFMISRAGTGKPWLYQFLLNQSDRAIDFAEICDNFMRHLAGLAQLDSEYQALLQSRSLLRYYFRAYLAEWSLEPFYRCERLMDLERILKQAAPAIDGQNLSGDIAILD